MVLAKKLHQANIQLMQNLTNAIFPRNQKSYQAQSLYINNILIRALYVSIFFLYASHLWSSSQKKTIQFAKILLHKTVLILTLCKIDWCQQILELPEQSDLQSHPLLQEQPSLPQIPLLLQAALLLQYSTKNRWLFVVNTKTMLVHS